MHTDRNETQYDLIVPEEQDGKRLDVVLSVLLPDISRSYLQKLIEQGRLKRDGIVCRSKKTPVTAGAALSLTVPAPEPLQVKPEPIPLDICYEDQDVLIINKPRGMVVHPAPGHPDGTLVNAILFHCGGALSSINGIVRPGIVHRIDKDTSGLLMVAKNDQAHRNLAGQLEMHRITRAYQALVYHPFKEQEGTIDAPLGRDPGHRLRWAVVPHGMGKRAVTHYRVLESLGQFALIEARLETGRTHQIRVHMRSIGHPLVGDPLYGPSRDPFHANGQMLHAGLLGFCHPRTKQYMEFYAAPPKEFQRVLEQIRKRGPSH